MKHNQKHQNTLKIAFILDPPEKLLLAEDSTISIMVEAQKRGHLSYYLEPQNLFFSQGSLLAHAREVEIDSAFQVHTRSELILNLNACDAILNRKEPPFDLSYLYLTQLLEWIEPAGVFVMNSPEGVRKANEKLYILNFPEWIPRTLVTNHPDRIKEFQASIHTDLVLKPLDQKGGAGIILLKQNERNADEICLQATDRGSKWIMAQEFLTDAYAKGDKRILLLDGKILGQYSKIPKAGEFRSNVSLGASYAKADLTPKEYKLVEALTPALKRAGLYFVGIDVMQERLLEVNVTCPAGIYEINALEAKRVETQVVDFLETTLLNCSKQR